MRLLALFSLLALAACATDESAGTDTPAVTTPAEAPVESMGDFEDVPSDSATSVPTE